MGALKKRPRKIDVDSDYVAELFYKSLNNTNWFDSSGMQGETSILDDIKAVMKNNLSSDAYAIAKAFDNDHSWPVDAIFVDECGIIDSIVSTEYKNLVKEWVEANKLKVWLLVGDLVEFQYPLTKMQVQGTIIRVYHDAYRVVVTVPSLGHLPSAGIVVNCENGIKVAGLA